MAFDTTPIQETWQEEFDKRTKAPNWNEEGRDGWLERSLFTEYDYPESEYELSFEKVKDFIYDLLQRKERETIKRVMEVIPKRTFDFPMGQSNEKEWWHNHGWNSAIDLMTDNINKLK